MPPAGQRDEDVAAFMDQQFAVDAPVALPRETPYPFAALATVRSPVKALGLEEVAVGSVQLPPSSGSTAVDGFGFLCCLPSTGFFMLYQRWARTEASSVPLRSRCFVPWPPGRQWAGWVSRSTIGRVGYRWRSRHLMEGWLSCSPPLISASSCLQARVVPGSPGKLQPAAEAQTKTRHGYGGADVT